MKRLLGVSIILLLLMHSMPVIAAKKHCQSYRQKLDNIQSQQRQGNSLKRSNSLAKKEKKARDTWWRCETGKLKPKSKKKKVKLKSKKKPSKKYYKTDKKQHSKLAKTLVPFANSKAIVVKAKYQGEKLQAWLKYYRPEKKCARPKSTQIFAACVEDKRRQQGEFEESYLR